MNTRVHFIKLFVNVSYSKNFSLMNTSLVGRDGCGVVQFIKLFVNRLERTMYLFCIQKMYYMYIIYSMFI
jgi:hypothetical protein